MNQFLAFRVFQNVTLVRGFGQHFIVEYITLFSNLKHIAHNTGVQQVHLQYILVMDGKHIQVNLDIIFYSCSFVWFYLQKAEHMANLQKQVRICNTITV